MKHGIRYIGNTGILLEIRKSIKIMDPEDQGEGPWNGISAKRYSDGQGENY